MCSRICFGASCAAFSRSVRPHKRSLLLRWAVLAVAVAIAVAVTNGINVHGGVSAYIGVAAILGLVNAITRPLVRLLSLPLTVAALGLFSLVINGSRCSARPP
jgi:uncharacterized membrane protein YvlD (DUF360 family)